MTSQERPDAAGSWEGLSALAVLEAAAARFAPRLTLATALDAEGSVLVDLVGRNHLPIDIFVLDTGLLFAETYALRRELQERYGIAIRGALPALDVAAQAAVHGPALWERAPDVCCGLRKVAPLRAELARFDAWITGIRRDQTPERATAKVLEYDERFGLWKVNPLAAWTARDVWRHLRDNDVPVNALHDRGYPSIGCWPCTTSILDGEDPRNGRWRGQAKRECGLHAPTLDAPAEAPAASASAEGDRE